MSERKIITAEPDSFIEYFRKLWQYRNLIWVFAKRDLKVKYSQTLIGVGWTILQPLTSLVIFSFFFGYLLGWNAADLPFPIYVLSGLLGWNFFSYVVYSGSGSVQEASHIIKKIYFPKSILPLSKVLISFTELGLTLLLFVPLMLYYGQKISWHIVFLPFVLLYNTICALTLVFWIAALAYKKRDLFHLLPYMVMFGIWLTPVFFTIEVLPAKFQFLLYFNPMANVVSLWRWILFSSGDFNFFWLTNFIIVALFCLAGMYYYNLNESKFSDFV